MLLRPLLRRRPTLQTALLVDAQSQAPGTKAFAAAQAAAPPVVSGFKRGDALSVWSNSAQRWCAGTVVDLAEIERAGRTGTIPGGSVEVEFELGRKWIAPQDVARVLRACR